MEETRSAHVPAGERLVRVETQLTALREDVERLEGKVDRLTEAHQQRRGVDVMVSHFYETVKVIGASVVGAVAWWLVSHK